MEPEGAGRPPVDDVDRPGRRLSRRGLLGLGVSATALAAAGAAARTRLWTVLRWQEDFFPGTPSHLSLPPHDWPDGDDHTAFAVLGDNGSGGRNAMDVGAQMARTYLDAPFGAVLLAGDISYYGSIADRWQDVFVEPYGSLIDAGVAWELAIGNHELEEPSADDPVSEVTEQLRRFGKPGTHYTARHGSVDVFVLDTATPIVAGADPGPQQDWFADALAASDAPWKVAVMHHPPYSSGKYGSNLRARGWFSDIAAAGGVDVVFAGHDHHYERTVPVDGVTYVVSGGGCKLTGVTPGDFTAHAASALQFMHVDATEDRMLVRCIGVDGTEVDRVTIPAGR